MMGRMWHPTMRNHTVGPGLELSTCARPSQTPDPDLGVTVKHSFLLFLKDIFNISLILFGHLRLLGALGLLITFPVLG